MKQMTPYQARARRLTVRGLFFWPVLRGCREAPYRCQSRPDQDGPSLFP